MLKRCLLSGLAIAGLSSLLTASPEPLRSTIRVDDATRVMDPKLEGGSARFALHLAPQSSPATVTMQVLSAGVQVAQPWTGTLTDDSVHLLSWDGRDSMGDWCSTGSYTIRFATSGQPDLDLPLNIVRLGVTEIEALSSAAEVTDEFPMVYFRKASQLEFYATPQICEYANLAPQGEVSALDFDDGRSVALPTKPMTIEIPSEATVTVVTPGAGGYGAPAERSQADMEDDFENGLFSAEYMKRNYAFEAPSSGSGETDEEPGS